MPSRSLRATVAKEVRELASSRAALLVAIAVGPLVAHALSTAMDAYAEASGVPGGAAALTQALSPLDGLVSPLFGAYAVAATLLFPFVAIRTVSAEKESGAHTLMLQGPHHVATLVMLKFAALLTLWIALWIPGIVALALWSSAGGHLSVSETMAVLAGHLLHGGFVAALGIACAAVTESGASAAVLALAVTLGGWAADFTAAVRGGWIASVARFTPDAALRSFERGQVDLGVLLVTAIVTSTLLMLAMVWLDTARSRAFRIAAAMVIAVELAALAIPAATARTSWDLSEDRRNSFSDADQRALADLTTPVTVTVHLGPEDPRRTDLEREVLSKLRRTVPRVRVDYAAQTSTGLFEGAGSHYGEVWYQVGDKREMLRARSATAVLDAIYTMAGRPIPQRAEEHYPGYPLRAHASALQLGLLAIGWPLILIAGWLAFRRRGGP